MKLVDDIMLLTGRVSSGVLCHKKANFLCFSNITLISQNRGWEWNMSTKVDDQNC